MFNPLENKKFLVGVGTTFTAISAAAWGYIYACHELEKEFDDRLAVLLDQEVEKIKGYYEVRNKYTGPEAYSELPDDEVPEASAEEVSIPMDRLNTPEGRAAVMAELQSMALPETEDEEENLVEENAFVVGYTVPEFDWEEMISERSAETPYIISREEYLANEAHYEVHKLTFFEGDGVLLSDPDIDGKEEAIPDSDMVVGDKNLQMFGVMSGNNNILYVQNDRTEAMFAIHRDFRKASVALFGPDADEEAAIEHSSMKRRRPRSGDE